MEELAEVPGLGGCLSALSEAELTQASALVKAGQADIFAAWPPAGQADEEKRAFFEQARTLDANYPGGLAQYISISNARKLLDAATKGENSLDGWSPSVPSTGVDLAVGSDACCLLERRGLEEVAACCFVIPAGGLGERLGFNGVKFALPAEVTSGWCVLEVYAAYIRAFEALSSSRAGPCRLPLVIMASADTAEGIRRLLAEKSYFGLSESQVTILLQEKVAALADSSARLAMETLYKIATKPHGHGDVHFLLHSSGLLERWLAEGRRWVYFFQDTNTLYLGTLLSTLGVSATQELEVNSVAMPRRAKEAVGAIAKLTHVDGRSIVVNVEARWRTTSWSLCSSPQGTMRATPMGQTASHPTRGTRTVSFSRCLSM
ncbi:unnamed protein product [Prorocentrum cordatum]|uniref:UTP-monosaccharide-1-phosphate uridylyltransferase n=1 Tax=Prorocentrum cordatum TaxID=2364126 RepID=A0ABN9V0J1_9DINO|nr:unnamed protein product [Polarella glacialis]